MRKPMLINNVNYDFFEDHIDYLSEKQIHFIVEYGKNNYSIRHTCEAVEMHKDTYYKWMRDNTSFKYLIEKYKVKIIDDAKGVLYNILLNGKNDYIRLDAAKFILKTLGKAEFSESLDLNGNIEVNKQVLINIVKPNNLLDE